MFIESVSRSVPESYEAAFAFANAHPFPAGWSSGAGGGELYLRMISVGKKRGRPFRNYVDHTLHFFNLYVDKTETLKIECQE